MKHTTTLSLGIFFFGCLLYVMTYSGWSNYLWDRFRYGASIHVAEKCFNLPFGWAVFPGGDKNNVDVRRHFFPNDGDVYAHIHSGNQFDALSDALPSKGMHNYVLYDLGANSSFHPIRFIAVNKAHNIGIVAAREDFLLELVHKLSTNEHCDF